MATAIGDSDSPRSGTIQQRSYHAPSIVQLGSIESARKALEETRDPRLLLIVERWSMITEEIRQGVAEMVQKADEDRAWNGAWEAVERRDALAGRLSQ
jgi:hypothetical protein